MTKAFTLLEIILVIILISIVSTFAISKFTDLSTNTNMTKLKNDYTLIRNNISKFKSKQILLGNESNLISLDNAMDDTKNEKLFTNILEYIILSTNTNEMEVGKWIKVSNSYYDYVLSSNQKISFVLENNQFICKSDSKTCQELE